MSQGSLCPHAASQLSGARAATQARGTWIFSTVERVGARPGRGILSLCLRPAEKCPKTVVPARESFKSVSYSAFSAKARLLRAVCGFVALTVVLSPRDEVNKAYRKLAVLLHPDKCVAPGSEDAFKAVVNARTALLKNIK